MRQIVDAPRQEVGPRLRKMGEGGAVRFCSALSARQYQPLYSASATIPSGARPSWRARRCAITAGSKLFSASGPA